MTTAEQQRVQSEIDIVAFAENGDHVLVGEVKKIHPQVRPWTQPVLHKLAEDAQELNARFMMTVDLDQIRIFAAEDREFHRALFEASTPAVLGGYGKQVDWESMHPQYLELLVQSWLLDVALGRDRPTPEIERRTQIGLAQELRFGEVVSRN